LTKTAGCPLRAVRDMGRGGDLADAAPRLNFSLVLSVWCQKSAERQRVFRWVALSRFDLTLKRLFAASPFGRTL